MKTLSDVHFPLAGFLHVANLSPLRNMNRLLLVLALSAAPFLAGCVASKTAENAPLSRSQSTALATLTTPELEAKRAALQAEIVTIEREVEMKAGLHMGVSISDERGRLGGLYREAQWIDRELLRRSAYSKL